MGKRNAFDLLFDRKKNKSKNPLNFTSPLKSNIAHKKMKIQYSQMKLDLGQKTISECVYCKMTYRSFEKEDCIQHEKNCVQFSVKLEYRDEISVLQTWDQPKGRLSEISSKLLLGKVKAAMEVDLGRLNEELFYEKKRYMAFIVNMRIIGCIVVQDIEYGCTLEKDKENIVSSNHKVIANMGIGLIWVHRDCRRMGIAKKMLDGARMSFVYGMHIAKNRIAFSQPTNAGLAFAKDYVHPHEVLVYEYLKSE